MSRLLSASRAAIFGLAVPLVCLTAQNVNGRPTLPPALDSVRNALEKYQDPIVAVRDGYLSTVACADFPEAGHAGSTPHPAGAMGVHLLNMALVGPQPDPAKPTVLLYEPHGDTLQLVGAEWFVPTQLNSERPTLFGRAFDGPMAGHEPIMPAGLEHFDLHVWLWRENPAGLFTPTNPKVKCPAAVYTEEMREAGHHH